MSFPKESFMSKVRQLALEASEKDDLHGFSHVERVHVMAIRIGKKLNANLRVLKVAALLHDIGRKKQHSDALKRNHAEISALITSQFLHSAEHDLDEEEVENILHSIRAHSFSNGVSANTLEAKILSDSDKLDALGAIGLYRTIGYTVKQGGDVEGVIKHLENKILKLHDKLYLEISRELGGNRRNIVIAFYEEIKGQK